jgi:hypothetical protein
LGFLEGTGYMVDCDGRRRVEGKIKMCGEGGMNLAWETINRTLSEKEPQVLRGRPACFSEVSPQISELILGYHRHRSNRKQGLVKAPGGSNIEDLGDGVGGENPGQGSGSIR